jgi:hypothetical protein
LLHLHLLHSFPFPQVPHTYRTCFTVLSFVVSSEAMFTGFLNVSQLWICFALL